MPYYEIIYETGNNSIANYADDEEAINAISAHHDRAKIGLPAQATNPEMGPAERIVKVLKYDEHPANYGESQAVDVKELQDGVDKAMSDVAVGSMVSVPEFTAKIRDITSPVVESGAHESNYKMKETGELTGWGEG